MTLEREQRVKNNLALLGFSFEVIVSFSLLFLSSSFYCCLVVSFFCFYDYSTIQSSIFNRSSIEL